MPLRQKLQRLDRLTWETGQVSGEENFQLSDLHLPTLASTPRPSNLKVTDFLRAGGERAGPETTRCVWALPASPPSSPTCGTTWKNWKPGWCSTNFPGSSACPIIVPDLAEQYFHYTYPYDVFGRLADLQEAVRTRRLDGLVHYTQSFCFRQMFDQIIRERLNLPVLTIEGDRPSPLDSRTRMRLEAFVDVLRP